MLKLSVVLSDIWKQVSMWTTKNKTILFYLNSAMQVDDWELKDDIDTRWHGVRKMTSLINKFAN